MLYNLFENRDFVSVFAVALLAEGVDRNYRELGIKVQPDVALLAGGVDRNTHVDVRNGKSRWVALLAEGVDRNSFPVSRDMACSCRPPRGGRG